MRRVDSDSAQAASERTQRVHPAFEPVVQDFRERFGEPEDGGGALCVRLHGEVVVDAWAGWADVRGGRRWGAGTGAVSFSTTKGLTSTLLHRLVEAGVLDLDRPVATWWPEFAAAGKERLTLRDLMTHRAGLSRVRPLVSRVEDLLDHRLMAHRLARTRPQRALLDVPAYHALTYGYLAAAVVEAATGRDFRDVLAEELTGPLGLETGVIGLRDESLDIARLSRMPLPLGLPGSLLARAARATKVMRPFADALLVDGFEDLVAREDFLRGVLPAANGVVNARDLATVYAALAGGGNVDGVQLLSKETVHRAGRVQTRQRDRVLGFPMRWRLGYHHAFLQGAKSRRGFGHYGYGGSGAWADPDRGLAVAFTTNKLVAMTTPIADSRLMTLSGQVVRVVDELEGRAAA